MEALLEKQKPITEKKKKKNRTGIDTLILFSQFF